MWDPGTGETMHRLWGQLPSMDLRWSWGLKLQVSHAVILLGRAFQPLALQELAVQMWVQMQDVRLQLASKVGIWWGVDGQEQNFSPCTRGWLLSQEDGCVWQETALSSALPLYTSEATAVLHSCQWTSSSAEGKKRCWLPGGLLPDQVWAEAFPPPQHPQPGAALGGDNN